MVARRAGGGDRSAVLSGDSPLSLASLDSSPARGEPFIASPATPLQIPIYLPVIISLTEVICLNIMAELAIIFGICLLAEGIAAILPVAFPASVISLVLLLLLLLSGIIKDRHISRVSRKGAGEGAVPG